MEGGPLRCERGSSGGGLGEYSRRGDTTVTDEEKLALTGKVDVGVADDVNETV